MKIVLMVLLALGFLWLFRRFDWQLRNGKNLSDRRYDLLEALSMLSIILAIMMSLLAVASTLFIIFGLDPDAK